MLEEAIKFHQLGMFDKAKELYLKCGEEFVALLNLSLIYYKFGDRDSAITTIKKAIKLNPNSSNAFYNLGIFLQDIDKNSAIDAYKMALELDNLNAKAMINLSFSIKDLDLKYAINLLESAKNIEPTNPIIYNNLGNLNLKLDLQKAILYYQKAINLNPNYGEAYNNLANGYILENRLLDATEAYLKSLSLGYEKATVNFSYLLLAIGDFSNGWGYYYQRFGKRDINFPKAKEITLIKEQGIGDELFFLRFAPLLKEQGYKLIYNPSPKIKSIIEQNCVVDEINERLINPIYMGDLPLFCNSQTPSPLKLKAKNSEKYSYLKESKKLIGLTYRAGVAELNRLYKEIDLKLLIDSLKNIDAKFILLQRNPKIEEIELLKKELDIIDFSDLNEDLEEMLSLLTVLDDYIAISNTNIHLYAGLDKKAKILVPFFPEWRWGYSGDFSHWFGKNFQIFRQDEKYSWQTALSELQKCYKV